MKKLTIVLVIMLSMALMLSGVALAATTTLKTGSTSVGTTVTATFQPSTNVSVYYTPGTNGISYGAGANHNKGSKSYEATSSTPQIYWKTGTAAITPTAPTSGTDTTSPRGYSAL